MLVAAGGIFFMVRSCSGCGKEKTTVEVTTDTVTTEVPGIVETETPEPTVQIPPIDSSIFVQLDKYKRLWQIERAHYEALQASLQKLEAQLLDTTIDLAVRYNTLAEISNRLKTELAESKANAQKLQDKLEETANGSYLTEGTDSTGEYKLEYKIFSRGPLFNEGFNRKVTVYQKEITNTETTTKIEYPSLFVGAMYSPGNGPDKYSLLAGKDWGRFGVISHFTFDKEINLSIGAGVKINL